MSDITLGNTIYRMFTTRRFSTGAPFTLAGTPVVSAYENDSLTQITAGITLGVDHDSVTGLNLLTIVATSGNGYESGKDYSLVITTGTVDSVSVVGEVVGQFTIERSAAAQDLANGTDGLGAIKADTAAILVDTGTTLQAELDGIQSDTEDIQSRLPATLVSGRIDASVGAMAAGTVTAAAIATDAIDADALAADAVAEINATVDTALADIRLDELLAADSDIDGAAPPTVGSVFHELMSKTTGSFTFDQTTDSLEAVRDRGDAAWITATGFSTHSAADVWASGTRTLTASLDPTAAQIADAVWDEAQSGHTTAGTFGRFLDAQVANVEADTQNIQSRLPAALVSGRMDSDVGSMQPLTITSSVMAAGAISDSTLAIDAVSKIRSILTGSADSGTTTSFVDAALTQADTDYWKGCLVLFTSGNIAGQVRLITGFTPGTDTVTFHPATTQAVTTHSYEILSAARVDIGRIDGAAISTTTAQLGVNTVQAGGTAWGSGAITAASIAADAIGASALAADAVAEIQSGLATSASISALNNISAAEVNAEVVDALNTDTYAEPGQGAPAATASLATKIGYLYKNWRNKKEQTSTTYSLYDDAGTTVDQKSTVSDNGTTATRGEVATGP